MIEEIRHIYKQLLASGGGLQAVPLELLWLLVIVGAAGAVFLLLRLSNWRLRRRFEALARLTDIEVRLTDRFAEIEAVYEFRFRGRVYHGSGVLPLHAFVPGEAWLGQHPDLDAPVLVVSGTVYVGEEAIEHTLLSARSSVPVRFLSADPTRNSPMVEALR